MVLRLIMAIISTGLEEVALVLLWRWGLPYLGIYLPLPVLIAVMVVWAAYAVVSFMLVTCSLKKAALAGLPAMVGCCGKVVKPLNPQGMVKIASELWGAECTGGEIESGAAVQVVGQEGLKLIVRKIDVAGPVPAETKNHSKTSS